MLAMMMILYSNQYKMTPSMKTPTYNLRSSSLMMLIKALLAQTSEMLRKKKQMQRTCVLGSLDASLETYLS